LAKNKKTKGQTETESVNEIMENTTRIFNENGTIAYAHFTMIGKNNCLQTR
jgi:hypothetical protein